MKPKILLVDDEPDALEVLGFRLREAGFTPILAKDGARAITAARDEDHALSLLAVLEAFERTRRPLKIVVNAVNTLGV